MGGADAVLARAQADFDAGEYRWVAQVCAMVCHAGRPGDDSVARAGALGADALEQLGYQAESATWRNAYLQGALELRQGPPQLPPTSVAVRDIVRALPLTQFLDMLAMRIDGSKAEGLHLRLNWRITGTGAGTDAPGTSALLNLEHGALTHRLDVQAADADASVAMDRATFDAIALQTLPLAEAVQSGRVQVQGRVQALGQLFGLLDSFSRMFPVVGPRPT
jgi:alkyl sulfatase BDS1-like metallo-beta-lactamase superfamily hydrolase